ncbi:hypothetical protein ACTXN9_09370 [Corynebacterium casei]|uniref:hypothetical protein n=1 Tax=Corynebacterium casei TaxID=160386 RepID=UPI000ECB0FCD|nr:hypothetical protein [Corynebacterium casei]MDN5729942.1 hypothetical protein [Corynebacterium casei]MDN5741439.1 hypothetical protein [Corynebacterium casei]MDN5827593.1 hypothetical protein [Corynebacterium casei]MDN5841454.1 hypothetical protein [Corynebacterium casei]MDN6444943.1 hypothetical protein [Corynebacterium casei]
MGRIILLLLIIAAVILVWKAFGPSSWKRKSQAVQQQPKREIKGPDDDEDFLWNLEKEAFKQRRARERAEEENRRSNPKNLDESKDPDSSPDELDGDEK